MACCTETNGAVVPCYEWYILANVHWKGDLSFLKASFTFSNLNETILNKTDYTAWIWS